MRAALTWACILALGTIGCLGGGSPPPTPTPSPLPTATATPAPTVTPTPTPARIELESSVSTIYYDVTGLTRVDIFASADANGPGIGEEEAWGLASWEWKVPMIVTRPVEGGCGIASVSMSVDLVVTLPRHVDTASLSAGIADRWQALAAEVAAHEQTHVDIVLNGMAELEQKLTELEPLATCPQLRDEIMSLWAQQDDLVDAEQEAFHAADEARIAALRSPLEQQIAANQGRLASLEAQADSIEAELAAIEAELADLEARYPDLVLPPDDYNRYQALVEAYNTKVSSFNSLIDEHDTLVNATNALVEEVNWIQ